MAAAAILIAGAMFFSKQSEYRWDNYAALGTDLYVVKITNTAAPDLPVFARSPPKILSKTFEVVAIDLSGKSNQPRAIGNKRKQERGHDSQSLPEYGGEYEYVELGEDGKPQLWSREELKARLLRAREVACASEGRVIFDSQDSRVFYLYCEKGAQAYRVELPSMRIAEMTLGESVGMPSVRSPEFLSVMGQQKAYVVANGETFEVPLAADSKPSRIENMDTGVMAPRERPALSLIGAGEKLRIYQVSDTASDRVQARVQRDGEPQRDFPLPVSILKGKLVKATYLPRSKMVLWEVQGEIVGKTVIYSLNIGLGNVNRAVVSTVE